MYRFSKDLVHELFLRVNHFLESGVRRTRKRTLIQFIVSPQFYTHGSYHLIQFDNLESEMLNKNYILKGILGGLDILDQTFMY